MFNVYNRYTDTAGNLHFTDCYEKHGREHIIRAEGGAGMSELKPCPFCGGALHIWKQTEQITPTIGKVAECDKCGVRISIPWAFEEFQAVEFLNRRANDGTN